MTTPKLIDYTQYRRNSLVHNAYIVVCPNCRKKGLRLVSPSNNGQQVTMYMHTGKKTLDGVEASEFCRIVKEVTNNE